MSDNLDTSINYWSNIGKIIKSERTSQGMSQQELAKEICSQAMISSIEKGEYSINAILLSKICFKLGISIEQFFTNDNPETLNIADFFSEAKAYCDTRQYEKLLDFINDSSIIQTSKKDQDLQLYYYYYGCAIYQTTSEIQLSMRYFHLALDYTNISRKQKKFLTPIEISLLSNLGVVYADLNQKEDSTAYFNMAYDTIKHEHFTVYDESINLFFYQYSHSLFKQKNINLAISILKDGINFFRTFYYLKI